MIGARAAAVALAGAAAAGLPAPGLADEMRPALRTLRDVSAAVRACWTVPDGLRRFEWLDATVRFSLRVDGSLQGEQRVSFVGLPPDSRARDLLARSAVAAVQACQPFNIAASLGQAIAGRVFAVRLVYRSPQGRGA
ncbi:hypothetical protein [uncultured Enterovirga sp.]|uniref:hypothetical protein n=1 Tax=uncultured Enterovirga sp. TaxID=2026352 RepID=UPI0035C9887D